MNLAVSNMNLWLADPGFSTAANEATDHSVVPPKLKHGMQTISKSDRKFSLITSDRKRYQESLRNNFPGLESDPVFRKISPLAVMLYSRKGPAVKAYTICWSITANQRTYQAVKYAYVKPGKKAIVPKAENDSSLKTALIASTAAANVIENNELRLVTPFFSWTPAYYRKLTNPDWETIISKDAMGSFIFDQSPLIDKVEPWLDAAIFADHRIAGKNKFGLGKYLRSVRNAERDQARIISNLLRDGESDDRIVQVLYDQIVSPHPTGESSEGTYELAKSGYAQFLYLSYQNPRLGGRAYLTKITDLVRRQRKAKFCRKNQ